MVWVGRALGVVAVCEWSGTVARLDSSAALALVTLDAKRLVVRVWKTCPTMGSGRGRRLRPMGNGGPHRLRRAAEHESGRAT